MRNFTCVQDLGNLKQALAEAFEIKKDRYQFTGLGKNKTLLMIFFTFFFYKQLYQWVCHKDKDIE